MSNEELKGLLLIGEDIEYQNITIRNYKLRQILKELKLDKYNYLLGISILDVKDVLKDSKIDIDKLKMYDIICEVPEFTDWFIEFLNVFTNLEWEFGRFRDFVAYNESGKRVRFTEDMYDGFMKIFKKMYCVGKGKNEKIETKYANDKVKKYFEEFEEWETNLPKKNDVKITLLSILESLATKHDNLNMITIQSYTVYQLMATYYRTEQIDNYDNLIKSYYTGMLDIEKINILDSHWAKETDII